MKKTTTFEKALFFIALGLILALPSCTYETHYIDRFGNEITEEQWLELVRYNKNTSVEIEIKEEIVEQPIIEPSPDEYFVTLAEGFKITDENIAIYLNQTQPQEGYPVTITIYDERTGKAMYRFTHKVNSVRIKEDN